MKKKRLLLSIVIPFKSFDILQNNILKSFEQPDDSYEVILIHDSIHELEKHEKYLLTESGLRFLYVHGNFGSPGIARNIGMDEASGEWIVFWDSDDFGFPNTLYRHLKNSTGDVFIGNFLVSGSDQQMEPRVKLNANNSQIALNPGIWRFAFKSEFVKKNRFRSLKLGEDILFLIESGAFNLNASICPDIIYEYRLSPFQSTRNMKLESNLYTFINILVSILVEKKSENIVVFEIFWRQIFSFLKISRGRKLLPCLKFSLQMYSSLNARDRIKFIRGIVIIFKKGII